MSSHLYNSSIGKVVWFARRFGYREILMKPIRLVFAPLILSTLPRKSFSFQGESFEYLLDRYNMTWAGERAVEVPIVSSLVKRHRPEQVLEVGNVLPHYGVAGHQVVDKFEKAPGVINRDIVEFQPAQRYKLIVSISTFEHIGFDDDEGDGSQSGVKILAAIHKCQSLLQSDGVFLLTVPTGYNPQLDQLIKNGTLPTVGEKWLRRTGFTEWKECGKDAALAQPYRSKFPYANGLLIASFSART